MDGLISIIIPVYNVEHYLDDCLKSVLGQTYPNLEVILIDDGSKDRSYAVCEKYAAWDKRVKLLHQENMGVSAARNRGLSCCTGDYIGFVDSDDTIELNMYEILLNEIGSSDADAAVCSYSYVHENKNGQHVKESVLQDFEGICFRDEALYRIQMNYGYKGYLCNKLFKRGLLLDGSDGQPLWFDEKLKMLEDHIFVTKVFMKCKRVSFIDRPLYNYLMRSESATHTFKIGERILAYRMLAEIVKDEDIKINDIVLWNLYTDNVAEMAVQYIDGTPGYSQNSDEIQKLRKRFLRRGSLSKLGLLRKIIIEYGIKAHMNKSLIKKISNL